MDKITLVKDGQRREFTRKAADILIEHMGWSEIIAPPTPEELGRKPLIPGITAPITLIEAPVKKAPPEITPVDIKQPEEIKTVDPPKPPELVNAPETIKAPGTVTVKPRRKPAKK